MERDIKRDRGMLEFTLKAFKDEAVAEEGHDFAATVTGCASLALDYLTLCEHQQRMIEAAIDEITSRAEEQDTMKGPCPGKPGCGLYDVTCRPDAVCRLA